MQSQQQMAGMVAMNANAGPLDGTPIMGNVPRPRHLQTPTPHRDQDVRDQLNTYIYDYFLRNKHTRLARMMVECDLKMSVNHPPATKNENGRSVNGVDAMDQDSQDDLPPPRIPTNQASENSFLYDWWCQFWDIYRAARPGAEPPSNKHTQYIQYTRNVTQFQNEQRNQRMLMNNMGPNQYQTMMRAMPNGVGGPKELQRVAAINRNPGNANPMANMSQMNKQAIISAQMQRDGSEMGMNGQRPQSPGSAENAASPNKRPRVEGNHLSNPLMGVGGASLGHANHMLPAGGMNPGNMPGNQFNNEFAQQAQNGQQKSIEVYAHSQAHHETEFLSNHALAQGMNVQGSPMNQQGLDGHAEIFAGNRPQPAMVAAGAPGQPQGNHALQDYQMQLMLLEQQNKKRLLMARQEQDNVGLHGQGAVGGPAGFPQSMSPQGSRAGPSPNPTDQMKRGTPKMNQQGPPGSPMPDPTMQQQRNSPAPNMNFDPSQMPPGMPPQFAYGQMPQTPMMRPPSSHPGFNGQQLTPQQMEMMRQNGALQNGVWRGPPQPGMMPNQAQQMGPMGNNPQMPQQRGQMPPPPAPANEQPRAQEPSPSQSNQAPPTPNQTNKPNPKKKGTKDNKKPAKSKGAAAAQAASNGDEAATPTPSTPVTPMHASSFAKNGQQPAQGAQPQPATVPQPPPMDNGGPPFGSSLDNDPNSDFGPGFLDASDTLENFDFDSFLHVGDDPTGFSSLGVDFGFGDGLEAGADQ
ncbi:hypothetical protein BDV95DRAFT_609512 [Massariosphaeria phaeospora]|uniref:LisH domain-containing protein n=1 Tax=Massariosphaeria phaeospora TaxID=100035 RepID=A0A7C8I5E2_9PLEO|nr:hypothetical protein BDV95DRAFT_609512 [Massariosphaeria phaeospora]